MTQIRRLLKVEDNETKEVIIKIIGITKWSNGHLHDGRVYQIFLMNMV